MNSEYVCDCLGETWVTDVLSTSDSIDYSVVVGLMNICYVPLEIHQCRLSYSLYIRHTKG